MRPPDSSSFPPGTYVGPYRIVRKLGRGGMGEVHEAIGDIGRVALKLVTLYGTDRDATHERFLREAESLRALAHPSIVSVLDHGIDPRTGTPYLAMELLDGDDLGARIEGEGALSEETVIGIGLDLVAALSHAHERRIVHRDVKPANVLIPRGSSSRARAVLCDFGLSKRVGELTSLTTTGALVGTPHYMSPEQFLDAKRVDERSDVFSLAMTLLHAAVGRNPLANCKTTTSLMMALCTRPIPTIEDMAAELRIPVAVSRPFSETLRRALATDPLERASLGELRRDLAACEAGAASIPAPRTRPFGTRGVEPRVPSTASRRPEGAVGTASRRAPSIAPRSRRSNPPRVIVDPVAKVAGPKIERSTSTSERHVADVRLGLGAYRVSERLAEAGLSLGHDEEGRPVRLEQLQGVLATDDGASAFAEETTAFGTVLTESVVALLDYGRDGDDAWLVTEPLGGPSLRTHVKESGPLAFVRAVKMFVDLARGLVTLHDRGIVHGHLAPEAFHLRSSGKRRFLVLHDLGIQKRIEAKLRVVSKRSGAKGAQRDPRGDVVQVVSSLYFAALGKVPFGARVGAAAEPKDPAHTTFAAPDPFGRTALDDLVRRTIEGRIATLGALADELELLLESSPA